MIDRSLIPAVEPLIDLVFPELKATQLNNGIPVYFIQQGGVPLLQIDVVFDAGNTSSLQKSLPACVNKLLTEGTRQKTSAEIFNALDYYGAYLETDAGNEYGHVALYTHQRHLEKVFPIFHEVLTEADFPQHEVDLWVQRVLQNLSVSKQKTSFLARNAFSTALFPEHPYGYVLEEEDYTQLKRADLLTYYQQYYSLNNAFIMVSGDGFNQTEILALLNQYWGQYKGDKGVKPTISFKEAQRGLIHVPKKGATQSSLRLGLRMPIQSHPDFQPLQVLVTAFGGYFGSRLMNNLREEKGYTYGIGSSLAGLKQASYLVMATDVGIEVTEDAIAQIVYEMTQLTQEAIPEKELQSVKNYILGQMTGEFETAWQVAEQYRSLLINGFTPKRIQDYVQVVKNVTAEQLLQLAQQYFKVEDLIIVRAGGM